MIPGKADGWLKGPAHPSGSLEKAGSAQAQRTWSRQAVKSRELTELGQPCDLGTRPLIAGVHAGPRVLELLRECPHMTPDPDWT